MKEIWIPIVVPSGLPIIQPHSRCSGNTSSSLSHERELIQRLTSPSCRTTEVLQGTVESQGETGQLSQLCFFKIACLPVSLCRTPKHAFEWSHPLYFFLCHHSRVHYLDIMVAKMVGIGPFFHEYLKNTCRWCFLNIFCVLAAELLWQSFRDVRVMVGEGGQKWTDVKLHSVVSNFGEADKVGVREFL